MGLEVMSTWVVHVLWVLGAMFMLIQTGYPIVLGLRIFNPLERWENQDWWRRSDVCKIWREALVGLYDEGGRQGRPMEV